MLQRILTALVGLVIFFGALFAGKIIFAVAIVGVIMIALYEMLSAVNCGKEIFFISGVSAIILIVGMIFENTLFSVVISTMLFMVSGVFLHTKYNFKNIYSSAFLTYFITLFFGALIKLRMNYGVESVFFVFLFAWMTDTGAYFCGKFFGKHKLIPSVSPKKTVEGAVGGVIVTAIFTYLYLLFSKNVFKTDYSYIGMIVLAVVASVLSQMGDLTASAIKRDCEVKDFGNLLPGHGGIMDRFDSVLFISPLVLYFFEFFNKFIG